MRDTLDLSKVAATAPPSPDKLSIIPIHTSDRANFKRCRRRWNWTSPMRENLRPKVTLSGVIMPLWFGTGIHYALEQYYDPVLRRDPVETFQTWYVLQWEGGVIPASDLRLTYDPSPEELGINSSDPSSPMMYRVRGLTELHPDPDPTEFEEHYELGVGMLTFYRQWAENNDNFSVIAAEHDFSVPLGLEGIDPRDGSTKPIHLRGRMDAIVQDLDSGRYGIIDHKTAARIDEDYFRKLEKDEQCTAYMHAAEKEAELYDLPYKQIDFVIYNAIRKAYPKPPTMTTRGLPSLNRNSESCTAEMFMQCIVENNLQVWYDADEKAQGYYNYLVEQGDSVFIQRDIVRRNRAEIESADQRIRAEVADMLKIPLGISDSLYPNPTGDYMCLNCPFRAPCIAFDDGSDWQAMINEGYEKNVDR